MESYTDFEIENCTDCVKSFDDLHLKEELLRGVYGYGFDNPSPIQQLAILPIIQKKDILAQAQSGTGKTGAFLISALQNVNEDIRVTQVLCLAPSRELAEQTYNVCVNLSSYMKVTSHLSIGGTSVRDDARKVEAGPHFLVGTPGRVKSHISRGILNCEHLTMILLDEADQMLSRGFQEDMYDIFQFVPKDIQACLFSATMPQNIKDLSAKILRNPVKIFVKQGQLSLKGIQQFYVQCDKEEYKFEVLNELYEAISIPQVIIYCNRKHKVMWLKEQMERELHTVSAMHGEMEQHDRDLVMKEFRSGSSRVLIATDLLARGIDANVQLVINYDLPTDPATYIHRIGRSGRFGKKGVSINFLTDARKDTENQKFIEDHYGTIVDELPGDLGTVFTF